MAAVAVDEPQGGGTFNTPGYESASRRDALPSISGSTSVSPDDGRSVRGADPGSSTNGVGPNQTQGNDVSRPANDPSLRRGPLATPKPSEFQKFVQEATGRLLPMFGSEFFREAIDPSLSSPDNVPVSGDYIVGAGDELVIRAWGAIDIDYRARVDRNGQVHLPKVGSFSVSGVKAADLQRHLDAQVSRLFTNYTLNVSLGQLRGVRVFVVGPAQRPGVYTLPSQSTLLSAAVAAGGPSPTGSMRKLSLRRDGLVISELDIYDFLVQGNKSRDLQLQTGDVVVFHPAGPRVALNGALDTPAIYELRTAQEPVGDVLRYAGGKPVLANPNLAQLERVDSTQPRAARFVEEFKLDASGLGKPLRDGDVLTLLAISPQFANAVTLKGHVAQPLRYAYKPGMRVSDLVPDKEALISPDFYRRKNLLVQVIDDEEELRPRRASRERELDSEQYTDRDRVDDRDRDSAAPNSTRVAGERDRRGDRRNLRNEDRLGVGVGVSQEDDRNVGNRSDRRHETNREIANRGKKKLAILFDELNWDYAVIERLNMKDLSTQVIPFNLGRAVIQRVPADNLELLPGDVVTVFSQKDVRVSVLRQTRLVSLEGEVAAPGVYQLMPGETLKGLIGRIGGFTPLAYVYGLEFSREDARRRQRENLQAAMARLEALAGVQAAREAANRREDDRSASVSATATEAQLVRLSRIRPNGRIALELNPQHATLEDLPDLPLEHGDKIMVPSRPGFITVAGAVVNGNAFIWKSGRSMGDYIRLAGLEEGADASNIFVLRADGTVVTNRDSRGFFGFGSLESQPLQPGDTIIVPNQLDYETWGRVLVRNLKDFAQIFSQFGLGAAAIQTLRNN